jgi:hypothetical protein
MADYAGAVAAIRDRFVAQWVDGGSPRTLIAFQNEPLRDSDGKAIKPPPKNEKGSPLPFVYFEVIGNGSELRGAGTPGDNVWLYRGGIFVHVFVPEGAGVSDAYQLAIAAGEIFRAATFYENGQGAKVVSMSPQIDGGGSDADNGNLFRVTCFVPFEYFHRG